MGAVQEGLEDLKTKNIPPWSYPDVAVAGAAAAVAAAASAAASDATTAQAVAKSEAAAEAAATPAAAPTAAPAAAASKNNIFTRPPIRTYSYQAIFLKVLEPSHVLYRGGLEVG